MRQLEPTSSTIPAAATRYLAIVFGKPTKMDDGIDHSVRRVVGSFADQTEAHRAAVVAMRPDDVGFAVEPATGH